MVMPDDVRDLTVILHLREDPLAYRSMGLHLTTLVWRKRPSFLEHGGRQAHLANVVQQTR